MVEADGEWHTLDNRYGSASWKASHPPSTAAQPQSMLRKSSTNANSPSQTPTKSAPDKNGKAKANDVEYLVLDSDDEDEGRVKRELSPSFGSGSSVSANQSLEGPSVPQTQTQGDDVIDLTADSDDEEPLLPRRVEKRKVTDEMSPTEQIWKKGRLDGGQSSIPRVTNGQVNGAGSSSSARGTAYSHYSVPAQNNHTSPCSPPSRYPPPFPGAMYPTYPRPPPLPSRGVPNPLLPYLPPMKDSRWP
jgi:E3 SUMO-protein ligase PIAS1